MLDDVIPPCGGFIPVRIDRWGYIKRTRDGAVVHRESRNLHMLPECLVAFSLAKEQLPPADEGAILELTNEGGGAVIWSPKNLQELHAQRVARFRGCYGTWPIYPLVI